MRINNNLMSLNTYRQYSINTSNAAASTEKLSSGYRINRAGDDAAGLAISEKMRAQIRGLSMASKNSQDAISLVQTAEGALNETHSILQRMRELAVQSSSDTNDSSTVDRSALDAEFQQLRLELNDIADKTAFNGKKLLNGELGNTYGTVTAANGASASLGSFVVNGVSGSATGASITATFALSAGAGSDYTVTLTSGSDTVGTATVKQAALAASGSTVKVDFGTAGSISFKTTAAIATDAADATEISFTATSHDAIIQTGANSGDATNIGIEKMDADTLGLTSTVNLATQTSSSTAITAVNDAINTVSAQRSKLGAIQNRLQHKINNLDTTAENLTAAESRIRDLDMAKEMTNYTKNNILVQAATAMLAQANSAPQGVLQLLK